MDATQWTLAVVFGVALVFTVGRWWNKDVKGAFGIAVGIILIAAASITLRGIVSSSA